MSEKNAKKSKTVVIAMDGSDNSRFAYQWYLDNCRSPEDKVYIIHAVDTSEIFASQQFLSPYSFDTDVLTSIIKRERERVAEELKKYADLLTKTGVKGTVKSVHTASPGEGIIQTAIDLDADVIFTGTRGMGTIRRTLLGSTSDYIVHHSPVPVVICKPQ